ncbi:N-acyl-L-homoserine lactone synthetase [Rhodopseudomonas rhenobacensis]|uniref:acyl-homoserine-lactone synthase n=1 Tax=Rhodopseudomonas rhenobacensis TaxID=87461 RepID=A0A7W7Z3A0_9BRAD|nr:acyl-homoserine-lactone synthase [Rhodopseudomonas rhenobacensis]MBB5046872.1 N-acyl-L-homoserine lactone synthetase [Rhodopseudomonas rhenobacensis]
MHGPPTRYQALITTEDIDPGSVRALLRLRKRLFVDKCGWQLPTQGDIERDQFDTAGAQHCLLFHRGELVGGFRAIRTDQPYLSQEIAPHLAERGFPRSPDIWEISRFGVLPPVGNGVEAARMNYAAMFRFAESRRATSLVALADLAYERFLGRMDIITHRLGAPAIIGTDSRGASLTAVAGEIPLDPAINRGLHKFLDLSRNLEIQDDTRILRRASIPA